MAVEGCWKFKYHIGCMETKNKQQINSFWVWAFTSWFQRLEENFDQKCVTLNTDIKIWIPTHTTSGGTLYWSYLAVSTTRKFRVNLLWDCKENLSAAIWNRASLCIWIGSLIDTRFSCIVFVPEPIFSGYMNARICDRASTNLAKQHAIGQFFPKRNCFSITRSYQLSNW